MEKKEKGSFVGSILLSSPVWDAEKLKRDLLEEWDIRVPDLEADEEGTGGEPMGREQPDSDQPGQEASDCGNSDNDTIVFEADDYIVAISLMPAPVPAGAPRFKQSPLRGCACITGDCITGVSSIHTKKTRRGHFGLFVYQQIFHLHMVQVAECQQVINCRETRSAFPFVNCLLRYAAHVFTYSGNSDSVLLSHIS